MPLLRTRGAVYVSSSSFPQDRGCDPDIHLRLLKRDRTVSYMHRVSMFEYKLSLIKY